MVKLTTPTSLVAEKKKAKKRKSARGRPTSVSDRKKERRKQRYLRDKALQVLKLRGANNSREALVVWQREDGQSYERWEYLSDIRELPCYQKYRNRNQRYTSLSPKLKYPRKSKQPSAMLSPSTENFCRNSQDFVSDLTKKKKPRIFSSLKQGTTGQVAEDDLVIFRRVDKPVRVGRVVKVIKTSKIRATKGVWFGVELFGKPADGEGDGCWPPNSKANRFFKTPPGTAVFIRRKDIVAHVKSKDTPASQKKLKQFAGTLQTAFFLGVTRNSGIVPRNVPRASKKRTTAKKSPGGEKTTQLVKDPSIVEVQPAKAEAGKAAQSPEPKIPALTVEIPDDDTEDLSDPESGTEGEPESTDDILPDDGTISRTGRGMSIYRIHSPVVGRGTTGYVKQAIDRETDEQVALKFLSDGYDYDRGAFDAELSAEQNVLDIEHPNVISLRNIIEIEHGNHQQTVLVYDFAPGGELFDMLMELGNMPEVLCRTYFKQLISGLEACHEKGIVHRDIKPQNILLDKDNNILIADFGSSRSATNRRSEDGEEGEPEMFPEVTETMQTWIGSGGYQAPEILNRQKYTSAVDIFSTGVVLFFLLTGIQPFTTASKLDPFYNCIFERNFDKFWLMHEELNAIQLSPECRDLLNGVLAAEPKERYSFEQIRNDAWFVGTTLNTEELQECLTAQLEEVHAQRAEKACIEEEIRNQPIRPLEDGACNIVVNFISMSGMEDEEAVPASLDLHVTEGTEIIQIIYHCQKCFPIIDKHVEEKRLQVMRGISAFVDIDEETLVRNKINTSEEFTILF